MCTQIISFPEIHQLPFTKDYNNDLSIVALSGNYFFM